MANSQKPKTTEKDRGAARIKRDWKRLSNSFVTIGVHEDAEAYTGPGDNPTVAEVAFWNEFGTKTSPERSFLRSTIDVKRRTIFRAQEKLLNNMVAGKLTPKQVLDGMGFRIQVLVQNRITTSRSWAAPNAPSTTARKLSGGAARGPTPLIVTTLLLRSITHETKIVRAA